LLINTPFNLSGDGPRCGLLTTEADVTGDGATSDIIIVLIELYSQPHYKHLQYTQTSCNQEQDSEDTLITYEPIGIPFAKI
jgi:hypothetical protein